MILTLGDSFTYGSELDNRLEHAWPYLLGKHLNCPVENLAQCGGSNDMMVRVLLEQLSHRGYDLVIIAWASIARFEAWNEFSKIPMSVLPGGMGRLPWVPDYYKYSFNEQFEFKRWAHQVLLVQQYLKSRSQPYLFVNVAGLNYLESNLDSIWSQYDPDYFVGWPQQGLIELCHSAPIGAGGHPLELGHQRIADEIKKYIRH